MVLARVGIIGCEGGSSDQRGSTKPFCLLQAELFLVISIYHEGTSLLVNISPCVSESLILPTP